MRARARCLFLISNPSSITTPLPVELCSIRGDSWPCQQPQRLLCTFPFRAGWTALGCRGSTTQLICSLRRSSSNVPKATSQDSGQLGGHQGLGRDSQESWFEEHMSSHFSLHVSRECLPWQVPGNTAMNQSRTVLPSGSREGDQHQLPSGISRREGKLESEEGLRLGVSLPGLRSTTPCVSLGGFLHLSGPRCPDL